MTASPARFALRARRNIQSALASTNGRLRGNAINAYWYAWTPNFGDLLTPALLRHFGWTPVPVRADQARVLVIGSILQAVPPTFGGCVLGTGLLEDRPARFERATFLALRGALTRELLGAPAETSLGDAGLLADRLLVERPKPRYRLGIVPHYADRRDPRLERLRKAYPEDVVVIDVRQKPEPVIREIARCETILSSSLHGLVTADSLGIPNGWLRLSDRVLGGGFKFRDYYSALDLERLPVAFQGDESLGQMIDQAAAPDGHRIAAVKASLEQAFAKLRMPDPGSPAEQSDALA